MPHDRRNNSLRLPDYDYSQSGGYYVTVCTHQKARLFGDVVDGVVQLSDVGKIVEDVWLGLPDHYYHLRLGDYVVMPNHIHAIMILIDDEIALTPVGADLSSAPTNPNHTNDSGEDRQPRKRHTISEIMRAFKSYSTLDVKRHLDLDNIKLWQRGFYDHIIRNVDDHRRIQQYIHDNPLKWESDDYYEV